MALGDEIDKVFRREGNLCPPTRRRRLRAAPESHAGGRDESAAMGLVVATQRSFHLLADRIEDRENP